MTTSTKTKIAMCNTCRCDTADFEYVCGVVECRVCADDRVLIDPMYHVSVIVNAIMGATSVLGAIDLSGVVNSRALLRQRVHSDASTFNLPMRLRRAYETHHANIFEVCERDPNRRSARRRFYAVLPGYEAHGRTGQPVPWVVLLGDENGIAYALREWGRGLITTDELLWGHLNGSVKG